MVSEDKAWAQKRLCPRCKNYYKGPGATSRRDANKEVCPDCGSNEAVWDLIVFNEKKWIYE